MSVVVRIPVGVRPLRGVFDVPVAFQFAGQAPDDPVPLGEWTVFIPEVSTRFTTVTREADRVELLVQALASPEDWRLATEIAARVVAYAEGSAECDADAVAVESLVDYLAERSSWQFAADLRVFSANRDEDIASGFEGPARPLGAWEAHSRHVVLGPAQRAQLRSAPDPTAAALSLFRNVLWPAHRYRAPQLAGLAANSPPREGEQIRTLAILEPGNAYFLPPTDFVGFHHGNESVVIHRDDLMELPLVSVTKIDLQHWTMAPLSERELPQVMSAARSRAAF